MYKLLRQLLFRLPPETSHSLSLKLMDAALFTHTLGLLAAKPEPMTPRRVMGLEFRNPIGLAAGLDKNAEHIDALAALGFGFIEVGTLTPRPQPGNPRPRLFRLPEQQAIINRMGFNNRGIDHALTRIRRSRYRGILGINIGKNFDTPVESASDDYLIGMQKAYALASYIAVNLSSPNTPGLRSLQFGDELRRLLGRLKEEQATLARVQGRYVPLVLKVAPDLSGEEIQSIAEALLDNEVDGLIATNTTLARDVLAPSSARARAFSAEAGGLSGAPLARASTSAIACFREALGERIPIIGVGGITRGEDALEKIQAGASLLQLYSGFIYQGPQLISEVSNALARAGSVPGPAPAESSTTSAPGSVGHSVKSSVVSSVVSPVESSVASPIESLVPDKEELLLYTTQGCHLCEQAEEIVLPLLQARGIALRKVEIAESAELAERYGLTIPVIQLGSAELGWPFTRQQAEALLSDNSG